MAALQLISPHERGGRPVHPASPLILQPHRNLAEEEVHLVVTTDPLREGAYWLGIYRDYGKGLFPEPGGRLDQSSYVLEMLSIMEGAYGQVQEMMEEEARKNAGGGGRPRGQMHSRG